MEIARSLRGYNERAAQQRHAADAPPANLLSKKSVRAADASSWALARYED